MHRIWIADGFKMAPERLGTHPEVRLKGQAWRALPGFIPKSGAKLACKAVPKFPLRCPLSGNLNQEFRSRFCTAWRTRLRAALSDYVHAQKATFARHTQKTKRTLVAECTAHLPHSLIQMPTVLDGMPLVMSVSMLSPVSVPVNGVKLALTIVLPVATPMVEKPFVRARN